MPARGYEFYLQVVNSISRYRVEHEKIKFISISEYVILFIISVDTSEIPNQLAFKGAIYYVTIRMVISSRVKI